MTIQIKQDFEYKGDDWWEWHIWLEGEDAELDQIDQVVYQLHPSFPRPVRVVTDRSTNFRLDTAGWGVFRIYAKVVLKEQQDIKIEHDLVLEYPDGTQTLA